MKALLLLPLCLVAAATAIAGDVLYPLNPIGRTEASFKDRNGASISVAVTLLRLEDAYPYRDALLWGGDVGRLPGSVVSGLEIHKDKTTIFVPLSAYGDLGDAKFVSFQALPHGFRISLHGGNTAASYDANLFFKGPVLIKREVRLRELPDETWERTMYGFPSRSDE